MEAFVSGHPRDAKKVSIIGAGRLRKLKNSRKPALRTPTPDANTTLGPFIGGKIRRVFHKTRLK